MCRQVTAAQDVRAGRIPVPNREGDAPTVPLVAEVVDAVIGGDTHRDTHALEMTAPTDATIATIAIDNDEKGFAQALAWIAEQAPGPRVFIGLEGTRSYGIGLARA